MGSKKYLSEDVVDVEHLPDNTVKIGLPCGHKSLYLPRELITKDKLPLSFYCHDCKSEDTRDNVCYEIGMEGGKIIVRKYIEYHELYPLGIGSMQY